MLKERIYQWLCKKVRGKETSRIRAKPAFASLCTEISQDTIEVRRALLALRTDGKVEYSTGSHGEPISAFITVIPPKIENPAHVAGWMAALEQSGLPSDDVRALEPIGYSLDGFNKGDMERLLAGLVRLRKEQTLVYGQCDFNVSAAYLMGSSKLLSTFDSRALRAFGIAIDQFPARTPYVVVGGNTESPAAVILIENPVSFERAITSTATERCLFVCTFGFGLSVAANDYGNQLAGIIEKGRAIVLNRMGGSVITIDQVLGHSAIHFWGDLDFAGVQIFERLASRIPQIQLSALYQPMIQAALGGRDCHPYVSVVGKSGQSQIDSEREDSRWLLKYCRNRAVDQEIVSSADLIGFAGLALTDIGAAPIGPWRKDEK